MELFKLKLIKAEFKLGGQSFDGRRSSPRPDTLAFDEEKKCFVVIEYKKEDTDRIYRQLLTYASASDNPDHQMEMIKTYSKMQKENETLTTLNPDEICWNNYYCIYIALDISDKLLNNLRAVRKSNDIRMYEIHLFEGTVILCRVDADDASVDDGLDGASVGATTTLPQPRSKPPSHTDPTPILGLSWNISSTHKPKTLVLPNGKPIDVKSSWSAVLREVACWLADKGHIKDKSQSELLRTEPLSRRSSQVQLSNRLYVNLDFVSSDILKRTQKLLTDIDYEPSNFKITLNESSKTTTKYVQPTPPPDLVSILDLKSNITIKHNPATLQFPDGTSTNQLRGWTTVLAKVASWLSKKGHIKEQSQSDTLHAEIHRKPSHRPVRLANGLYLNLNINAATVLVNAQKLLKDINYEPHSFKIGLKDKIS